MTFIIIFVVQDLIILAPQNFYYNEHKGYCI